jgi:hypothetical protein
MDSTENAAKVAQQLNLRELISLLVYSRFGNLEKCALTAFGISAWLEVIWVN